MKKKFVLFVLFFLLLPLAKAVVLTTEPKLYFKSVLQGGYAELETTVKTDSETVLPVSVSAAGPIKDWLDFKSETGLYLSKDQPLRLRVSVQPPKDTPPGIYVGYIVISIPEEGNKITTSTFANVANVTKIFVEITDTEIKDLDVKSIKIEDVVEGSPLLFQIEAKNSGNIEVRPTIKIEILNLNQTVLVSKNFEGKELLATQEATTTFEFPNELDAGKYIARVSVFQDGLLIKQIESPLTIAKKGSTVMEGKLLSLNVTNRTYVNSAVYVKGLFANTGELSVHAKLKVKVYSEGELVQSIEGEPKIVSPGEQEMFTVYFLPNKTGEYQVEGYIIYNGQETNNLKTAVSVGYKEIPLGIGIFPILLFALLAFLLWHFIRYPVKRKYSPISK